MTGQGFKIKPGAELHPEIGAALDIALGASVGLSADTMPPGLAQAWNDAADAGAFTHKETIGQLAAAFLRHRLAKLKGETA